MNIGDVLLGLDIPFIGNLDLSDRTLIESFVVKGNKYLIDDEIGIWIKISNSSNGRSLYFSKYENEETYWERFFKKLSEVREDRLNELGIV